MRRAGVLLTAVILLQFAADARAQGEAGFEVPGDAAPGATVRVGVRLAGAPGAGALDLEASFDPAVFAFDGAEPGPLAVGAMVEAREARPGQARLALVLSEGLAGDGVVCWLRFRAVGAAGARSSLTFGELHAWHADTLGEIPLRVTVGEIRVAGGAAAPPPAVPSPVAPPPAAPAPAPGTSIPVIPVIPAAPERPEDQQTRVILILGGLVGLALLFGVISRLRKR